MRSSRLAAVAAVVVVSSVAAGDEVRKNDGTRIEGDIIREDSESVTIKRKDGNVTIAKTEIFSIERRPRSGPVAELDKLKKETAERLEVIAKAAEAEGRPDLARGARGLVDEVGGWSLLPRVTRKPTTEEPASAPVAKKQVDFARTWDEWHALQDDKSSTALQKRKAMGAYAAEVNGSRVVVRVVVTEAHPDGSGALVTGSVDGRHITLRFPTLGDRVKLEAFRKGEAFMVEGEVRCEAYGSVEIVGPTLR